MIIRKNTKAFKTIKEIITACRERPDRQKLIRLYITRAGHSIKDRINVEGIQGDADLFYEMNYDAVWNNLESTDRQLHQSDDIPGVYFFHSNSNKMWDETPFEFDELVKKEFASLSDLPVGRKKEKIEKFVFPTTGAKAVPPSQTKAKVQTKKSTNVAVKGPRQPDYGLKRKIAFTDLDKIVFKDPTMTKKDVLDYYNRISEYILPYLKDRPLSVRLQSKSRNAEYKSLEALANGRYFPEWIQTAAPSGYKGEDRILCSDKDHLLFYVEMGTIEFTCAHFRMRSPEFPDYIVIEIESPETELGNAIDVATSAKEILSGLHLPSFVKTDGQSGLHVYVPLDSKSKFETGKVVAEYICKLIRLKVPDLVVVKGTDDNSYGKVSLNYLINEPGQAVVAPYSLVLGDSPTGASPLSWDEVTEDLQLQELKPDNIHKRLARMGDPFQTLFKKKANADALLERMEDSYSFLF